MIDSNDLAMQELDGVYEASLDSLECLLETFPAPTVRQQLQLVYKELRENPNTIIPVGQLVEVRNSLQTAINTVRADVAQLPANNTLQVRLSNAQYIVDGLVAILGDSE